MIFKRIKCTQRPTTNDKQTSRYKRMNRNNSILILQQTVSVPEDKTIQ